MTIYIRHEFITPYGTGSPRGGKRPGAGRKRVYASPAERQRAYRKRKAVAQSKPTDAAKKVMERDR
jgi:hypothetical protein